MVNSSSKKKRVAVHGVLLLDKPAGLSSNDALGKAKWLLNAAKAGHTGTLDPFATGLLPLCFGEATKFAQDLLDADKTYETVVHLGVKTNTGDTEGDVLEARPVDVTLTQIEEVLQQFRGDIEQVPPMHSALKRDGKPLYEYARAGITLEREARQITIHQLDLIAYEAPMLTLRVRCSKGTYIRVLGEDIGAALGCGAHLNALRRVTVGGLTIAEAKTIEQLSEVEADARAALLAPVDALLSSFAKVELTDELSSRFRNGQRLALGKEAAINIPAIKGRVAVYRKTDGMLLGTAQLQAYDILAPERLVALG
ncbi:MAG: tRNA pseudouridine(55) synthase TruB [Oxalicibacterium faecigallinarum]|uniref:tRNA pseudouridine(55) synthase TruB n=1 Tax=Oxalicibacterium faecigallinarum TaxID=573741 RepID=UPI00280A3F1D|nr:tRNA pseudouridine(55) synthase TruB [Oxalicibacterium faecigallinarum]MDQ7970478.1 tRNA pseudouridine(55) synthase TruB [Oxalicibacterium faecigallinarum]